MASTLLTRLDIETRSYHADADGVWLDVVAGAVSPDRYRALLVRIYGFEAPLEAALAYTPHVPTLIDLRRRARSGLLAQDLLALGMKPAQLSRLPQCMIAPFRGPAEALGWLYVHARGSHVHRSVRMQLLARMPALENASAYLGAAGGIDASWEELGRVLDTVAHTPLVAHQIVISGHDAFRCARDWLVDRELQACGA